MLTSLLGMKKLKLSKIDRFRKFLQNDRKCVAIVMVPNRTFKGTPHDELVVSEIA
jgi:hypothetical protein